MSEAVSTEVLRRESGWNNEPWRKAPLFLGLVLMALALLLGLIARLTPGFLQAEYRIDQGLHNLLGPNMANPALAFNYIFGPVGAVVIVVLLGFVIWLGHRSWRLGLEFAVLAGLGFATTALAKILYGEPRPALLGLCPFITQADCPWLISETGTDAFPSGHTAITAAIVVALALILRAGWHRTIALILGIVIVIATALSRMYLGVHYLTDVIGGALLASGTVLVAWWLYLRISGRVPPEPHPKQVPVFP